MRKTFGIAIAGLGQPLGGASDELRLGVTTTTLGSSPVTYYVDALASIPQQITSELDPLGGGVSQGTLSFEVTGLDRAPALGASVGALCLDFFFRADAPYDATLAASISDSATSFDINIEPGGAVPAGGDDIYLEREVMRVASVTGSGTTRTVTVQRGVYGTVAEAHTASGDLFIYVGRNALPTDREVTIYELDLSAGTEAVIWRGVVESVRMDGELTTLTITCRDLLGRLADRLLGVGRWAGQGQLSRASKLGGVVEGDARLLADSWGQREHLVEYVPLLPTRDGLGPFDQCLPVAVDGHAILLPAQGQPSSGLGRLEAPATDDLYRVNFLGGSAEEIDGQALAIDPGQSEYHEGYEIVPGDADLDGLFRDGSGAASDRPADIIRAILASTGTATWPEGGSHTVGDNGDHDWLPEPWGLALPDATIDHPSFDAHASAYPTGALRAQSYYLGEDDRPVKALDHLYELALSANSYLYLTSSARFAIRHLADPGLGSTDATLTADDIARARGEGQAPGEVSPAYGIELECAQVGPGGEPAVYLTEQDLNQRQVRRYRYLAEADKIEATRIYGDRVTHELGAQLDALRAAWQTRYQMSQTRLPEYSLELMPDAPRVTAGSWVTLSHPALIDTDGSRGISAHRCLVLSADLDLGSLVQRVRVQDWAPLSLGERRVLPAWRVESVTSATQFTVEAAHFSDDDRSEWRNSNIFAGRPIYYYHLHSPDGERLSTAAKATGQISGGAVTLSAAWEDGGGSITPSVGDVVLPAQYDEAESWEDATLLYAWLADDDGELGAAGDDGGRWQP